MLITQLPTPPSRGDSANFAARADSFLAALPQLVSEINELPIDANLVTSGGAAIVGFAPAGSITSTTVQAAIEEVSADLTALIETNNTLIETNLTSIQDGTVFLLTSVAGTNTITASISPVITAYVTGQTFRFVAAGANTGAVTININGLGAKAVTKSGATALAGGDIPAGAAVQVFYDGTQFQLSSGAGGGSSGVNLLTQANGVNVLAGTGQVLVGPIIIPTGQNITVASGARLVLL
jgi:hypothetical protein